MNLSKKYLMSGAIFSLTGILLGAFGAHGLKSMLEPAKLETFKTGVDYQMYHGLFLLGLGLLKSQFPKLKLNRVFAFTLIGILLFCMHCYLYALTSMKVFAMIVPFGGVSFLVSWFLLIYALREIESA